MAIRFTPSAHRHGISDDRARYVIENCPSPSYAEDSRGHGDKLIFLWADRDGVPLEVGAVEVAPGDLLVIHVMKMRKEWTER